MFCFLSVYPLIVPVLCSAILSLTIELVSGTLTNSSPEVGICRYLVSVYQHELLTLQCLTVLDRAYALLYCSFVCPAQIFSFTLSHLCRIYS